jgi:hypothetical protein
MSGSIEVMADICGESISPTLNVPCQPTERAPKSIITADNMIEMPINTFKRVRRYGKSLLNLLENGNLLPSNKVLRYCNRPHFSILIVNFETRLGKFVSPAAEPIFSNSASIYYLSERSTMTSTEQIEFGLSNTLHEVSHKGREQTIFGRNQKMTEAEPRNNPVLLMELLQPGTLV